MSGEGSSVMDINWFFDNPAESSTPRASTSSIQTGRPTKQGRVMGISCDNCKVRKVKCDRRERLLKKRETHGPDFASEDVSCSNCIKHSLQCHLTKAKPKPRLGARLKELHQKERERAQNAPQEDVTSTVPSYDSASSTQWSSSTSFTTATSPWEVIRSIGSAASSQRPSASDFSFDSSHGQPDVLPRQSDDFGMTHVRHTGLFQVPGLNRHLLEAALHSFFKWSGPTVVAVRGRKFSIGYRAFFALQAGEPVTGRPVSEGLILGLAAVGAGMMESDDAPLGALDKFTLQRRLRARFLEYLNQYSWAERSDEEGVDLLMASYCLSFLDIEEPEHDGEDGDNPLVRRPLSDEFLASLVFKLKLNRAPKLEPRAPADGPRWRTGRGDRLLDDWEIIERKRIFFSYLHHDGFRSMGTRRPFKIQNDSHDLEFGLPRLPRYDTGFTPHGPMPPELSPDGEYHPQFERTFMQQTGRLGSLVREHGLTFVSTRSQGLGVPLEAAIQSHKQFQIWYDQRPEEVSIWRRIPHDWHRGVQARPTGYDLSKILRCMFIELLFHGLISGSVTAVQDFGFKCPSEDSTNDAEKILLDMKKTCLQSLRKVAKMCRQLGTMGLLRCSPVVCRNLSAGWLMWTCGVVYHMHSLGTTSWLGISIEEAFSCCDDILFGISTVDSAEGTPKMQAALKEYLDKVRHDVRGPHASGEFTAAAINTTPMAPPPTQLVELMPDADEFLLPQVAGQSLAGVESTWTGIGTAPTSGLNFLAESTHRATGELMSMLSSQAQIPLATSQSSSGGGVTTSTVPTPQSWPDTESGKDATSEIFEQILARMQ